MSSCTLGHRYRLYFFSRGDVFYSIYSLHGFLFSFLSTVSLLFRAIYPTTAALWAVTFHQETFLHCRATSFYYTYPCGDTRGHCITKAPGCCLDLPIEALAAFEWHRRVVWVHPDLLVRSRNLRRPSQRAEHGASPRMLRSLVQ